MSRFLPTRASPPLKPQNLPVRNALSDISRSSAISVPELTGLTPDDVEIIDAVIQRAAPSATTFLTVFKAYSDVLHERGLDPHEVIYYGKLLKLGTLKGKNWGDKWNMVKHQHGYKGILSQPKSNATSAGVPKATSTRQTTPRRDYDYFHEDDTEVSRSASEEDDTAPQYHLTPHTIEQSQSESAAFTKKPRGLDIEKYSPVPQPRSVSPLRTRQISLWDSGASDSTEIHGFSAPTTPPSYRSAVLDPIIHRPYGPLRPIVRDRSERPLSTPQFITQAREPRASVINENEAWTKIQMLRDEKEADRFRDDKLVERCWEVWKQGFEWIHTTHRQIAQARITLQIRILLQRWRKLTASHQDIYQRVSNLSDNRRLKTAFETWQVKLKEKKQASWRNDMRTKMKSIREKRENKERKDAWAKWRQSYRSHLFGQRYTERLVLRFFNCWKLRLAEVVHLEAVADEFQDAVVVTAAERCWRQWRQVNKIRNAERTVSEIVGLRVIGEVLDVWKRRTHENNRADTYRDLRLMKSSIQSWKAARDRILAMEIKASKHLTYQDNLLVRAVARVWKAHERGRLLERVKAVRLMRDAVVAWRRRLREQDERQELALTFSLASNSYRASSMLQTWRRVYLSHCNALSFAVQFHSVQLRYKILLSWRIQLRMKLKLIKQAKLAEKFFIFRKAWRVWMDRFDESMREKKLRLLRKQKLKKCFHSWLERTRREQHQKLAEAYIVKVVAKRTMRTTLALWTNRVIDIKLRDLEVQQGRENAILSFGFKKWKAICMRHVEELNLMESYQDVKREENIRRMFHRWHLAARASRQRRITLGQKEDEMKRTLIAVAWDKWRDRFNDEKLRPIEYSVIIRNHTHTLFRAFGIWRSKTKSVPAIRYHASHSKAKFWENWRAAMPLAIQARLARQRDKKNTLSKCLERWGRCYRAKVALKAVARARYLRLPTTSPRKAISSSQSPLVPATITPAISTFPHRARTTESNGTGDSESRLHRPVAESTPFGHNRSGITRLLATGPRPDTGQPQFRFSTRSARESSPARPKSASRDPSPVRKAQSSAGGEAGSQLWQELRKVRQRSRPPTDRLEPP